MESQLADTGLDFEFVEAVDGRDLTDRDIAQVADRPTIAKYPDWLTPPMLGCCLSHLKTYRRIADSPDDVALVLEDDVILPLDMQQLVHDLSARITVGEVILIYYLGAPGRRVRLDGSRSTPLPSSRILAPPLDGSEVCSTGAYLISRETCRHLAQRISPIRAGPDSWRFFLDSGWIDRLTCVFPAPINVRNDFRSTLDHQVPHSLLGRMSQLAQDHRVFPIHHLLAARRATVRRRSEKVEIV
jgi:glycosyl transferase family 25